MSAYYNEIDPFAAEWLRNLIAAGHIAPGDVDTRSIEDVCPSDLSPYRQAHFFAGIGVWSHALRRAGWPDDRPVWTGSCPCQPFSAAGKGSGFADERHLWPHFHWLISQCRPDVVLGEQVASKDGLGWIDLVQADLEGTGYASGAVDTCAAGFGAPHIRQRLYWFGERLEDTTGQRLQGFGEHRNHKPSAGRLVSTRGSEPRRLGDGDEPRLEGQWSGHQTEGGRIGTVRPVAEAGEFGGLADADGGNAGAERQQRGGEQRQQPQDGGAGGLADHQLQQRPGSPASGDVPRGRHEEPATVARLRGDSRPGPTNGHWRDADWLFCRDGKWRPVEPGTFPLAHGAPARMGRLRGYGNAINAEAATAFIEAYLEVTP